MTLTNEMESAMELIENTDKNIFITGKAGTGKTTFLKHLITHLTKKAIVSAPTGVAAINAGGVTLHSLLSIPIGILDPDRAISSGFSPWRVKLLQTIDILIIDEISMVRPDIIDYVDKKLKMYRHNYKPFGGVQIVMFGDLYQLPPVVTNEEKAGLYNLYDGAYFFYSRVFLTHGFQIVEFNEIFRQKDNQFKEILNHIRTYNMTSRDIECLGELRDRKGANIYSNKFIHICSHRKDVVDINKRLLGKATHSFKAQLSGKFKITSAPCDERLDIRKGARIMMLVNDKEHNYYNGSLGIINSIDQQGISVTLDSGKDILVNEYIWESYDYTTKNGKVVKKVVGSCRQYPIALAWAITIHKSQGLTFDNIAIHTRGVFCPGQIYVALSRCTSLSGIVSDSFIDERYIIPDEHLIAFEKAYKKNDYLFNAETYKLMN